MKKGKFILKKNNKKKKKKGFTLMELLAVIVILAVIMVITIPTVLGSMNNAKEKSEEIFIASIERSLNKFIENELQYSDYTFSENKNEYVVSSKLNSYDMNEIFLKDNKNITFSYFDLMEYYPKNDLVNPKTNEKCDINSDTIIHIYKNENNEYFYKVKLDCLDKIITNLDEPEDPDLSTGLIPVVYNASGTSSDWFVADIEEKWYDYDQQWWANGVSVSNREDYVKDGKYIAYKDDGTPNEIKTEDLLAMFVWIPRFSYTIGCHETDKCFGYKSNDDSTNLLQLYPGAIDIKFILQEEKDLLPENMNRPKYDYTVYDRTPSNWMTHPVFTYNNTELSGFWFGKFETTGTDENPKILSNSISLREQSYQKQLDTAALFNLFDIYNLIGDAHMTNNSEWGAVAYLSQSIYGKYGNKNYEDEQKRVFKNNSSSYYTGRSIGESGVTSTSSSGRYKYDGASTGYGQESCYSCGTGASTTGTIYGVYDMNGAATERVYGKSDFVGDAIFETNNWGSGNPTNGIGIYYCFVRGGSISYNSGDSIFINRPSSCSDYSNVGFRVTLITE